MGLVYGDFTIRNARKRGLAPQVVRALVDTGANILCIPPTLAIELQLDAVEKREVVLADGAKHWVPYVGPVQLSFGKRHSFGGAFVVGDEVLVGAIALQDLDLIVIPALETISVHAASSHIARGVARGVRSPASNPSTSPGGLLMALDLDRT
jgi:clan AA aspartic protease